MSEKVVIKIKLLHPSAKAPARAKPGDAGFDLCAVEDISFQSGERQVCPLGLASEFTSSWVVLFRDRSSLGSRGLQCLAGVIDSTYRGEWKVILLNTGHEAIHIKAGDRIAQCLFLPVPEIDVQIVASLSETKRGDGGFGSTGK